MKYSTDSMKDLTFSVDIDEDEGSHRVLLHINRDIIIRFASLTEYEKFANDMLAMIPEIKDNM